MGLGNQDGRGATAAASVVAVAKFGGVEGRCDRRRHASFCCVSALCCVGGVWARGTPFAAGVVAVMGRALTSVCVLKGGTYHISTYHISRAHVSHTLVTARSDGPGTKFCGTQRSIYHYGHKWML